MKQANSLASRVLQISSDRKMLRAGQTAARPLMASAGRVHHPSVRSLPSIRSFTAASTIAMPRAATLSAANRTSAISAGQTLAGARRNATTASGGEGAYASLRHRTGEYLPLDFFFPSLPIASLLD